MSTQCQVAPSEPYVKINLIKEFSFLVIVQLSVYYLSFYFILLQFINRNNFVKFQFYGSNFLEQTFFIDYSYFFLSISKNIRYFFI